MAMEAPAAGGAERGRRANGGGGRCAGRADRGEWAPELQHGGSSAMGRCRGNSPWGRGRKQWRSQGASMVRGAVTRSRARRRARSRRGLAPWIQGEISPVPAEKKGAASCAGDEVVAGHCVGEESSDLGQLQRAAPWGNNLPCCWRGTPGRQPWEALLLR
jgi:hypothetical protein